MFNLGLLLRSVLFLIKKRQVGILQRGPKAEEGGGLGPFEAQRVLGLGEICPSSYLYSSRGRRTRPTGLGTPFPTRILNTPLKDHSGPNETEKRVPAHSNPATEMETPALTPNQMGRGPRPPRAQLAHSP